MNIICISSSLANALRKTGHTVLARSPDPGLHALGNLLDAHNFKPEPDLIFQDENLMPRVLFTDLPSFSCFKIFRSMDRQLNMFWHRHYGRLFDSENGNTDLCARLLREMLHSDIGAGDLDVDGVCYFAALAEDWRTVLRVALACFATFALPDGERALAEAWNRACITGREQTLI